MTQPLVELPTGIGFFLRNMALSTISSRVAHMVDHGVGFAAVGTIWQDVSKNKQPISRWINTPVHAKLILKAMALRGLKVLLWGYPMKGREREFVLDMGSCADATVIGTIPDPELRSKATDDNKNKHIDPKELQSAIDHARALMWELKKQNPCWLRLITSFGIPMGHPTMPWASFFTPQVVGDPAEAHAGVPQLYDEGLKDMSRGLEAYHVMGADQLLPAGGTYRFAPDGSTPRMTADELDVHLGRLWDLHERFGYHGVILWSEAQVSKGAWKIIEKYAGMSW